MKLFSRFAVVMVLGLLAGCGSELPKPVAVTPPPPPASPAKQALLDVANTGELGSGTMSLRDDLEKLKSSDEAKAKSLLSDLDRLQKMTDPAAIKTQAKKMADQL